jgi:putative oxidoreductase
MAPFVGVVETICGALIIVGLLTRLAAVPLIIIMLVALVSTKLPMWLGHDVWIFHLPQMPRYGFWGMAHEARADWDMLLGSLYLLIEGGGRWSLDALLAGGNRSPSSRGRPSW